tara:strand:+ start:587 stop:958 length:372 start_codon:yes stop_codon:yes gene_type:complete
MPTAKQARMGIWGTVIGFVALLVFQFVVLLGGRSLYAEELDFSEVEQNWKVCSGCHGVKAEGGRGFPALNYLDEDFIVEALRDYRNSTYRGDMSGIMFVQMATLKPENFELMAKYIKEISKDE